MDTKFLTQNQLHDLLNTLKSRFENHATRHQDIVWADVQTRLEANPDKLWSLSEMERTGGEPDVVWFDSHNSEYIFFDCVAESPLDRRNTCYDQEARVSRKEHQPPSSAIEMAAAMGIDLLTEQQYRSLQKIGEFDLKTSSWILTPPEIRKLGGALFADRRYDQVFVYHNGASSYYSARGFRGALRI